jgi:hypothetical protein
MENYRLAKVEQDGELFCVHLRNPRMDEPEIYHFAEELITLITRDGCRHLVLSLGPEPPSCLYSVFLSKLITVQRILREHGGRMALVEVGPTTRSVFEACLLDRQFTFFPDLKTVRERWENAE